jgi:precorrin-8X/cobalt-precorrin-8 methylmutase
MMNKIKFVEPQNIEKRSFEIIQEELGDLKLDGEKEPIIKRVIHTTADFDYLYNLIFSKDAVKRAKSALKKGATIITDTNMAYSGINKKAAAKYGVEIKCFMADEDVAKEASERRETRATVSMERASSKIQGPLIFAIGNAPTALIKLYDLIAEGKINPELIIGVPVGFVNVVEAKELIMNTNIPYIVAKGRKGGSNVAAAIINALLYNVEED